MTTEKLTSVFRFYQQWIFAAYGYSPNINADPTRLEHLASMCQRAITELIPAGRTEKAMRWLGFVQGVLVCRGLFTFDEVRSHSRS